MPIRFSCKCGKAFKVADKFAGKRVKCPACGVVMVVPVPAPPPQSNTPSLDGELELEMDATPPPSGAGDLELEMDATRTPPTGPSVAPEGELSMEEPLEQEDETIETTVTGGVLESGDDVEDIPLDAPSEAMAAPEAEKTCPKCGASVPANNVICTECGNRFGAVEAGAEEVAVAGAAPAKSKLNIPKIPMKFVIIGAAGVVVLAIVVVGLFMLMKKPDQKPTAPVSRRERVANGSRPAQPKKTKPKQDKKVEPKAVIAWEGFADSALRTRDNLLALGESMLAFNEQNNRFPASLDELDAGDTTGIVYVGRDAASVDRFRPLARASKADASGLIHVLFSDGTVRAVKETQLDSVLLGNQPAGLMTAPDAALLAQLGPQLRIGNPRFGQLKVSLDGNVLGTLDKGDSKTFAVSEGSHKLRFSARDEETEDMDLRCDAGILYEYTFYRYQDLPIIATHQYRSALLETNETEYSVERNGQTVSSLSGEEEIVHFTGGEGRGTVSRNGRMLNGWIEREHLKIEALPGQALLVNTLGRLEEGVVRYNSGQEVKYLRSALGTVAIREAPNVEVAALAKFVRVSQAGEDEVAGSGRGMPDGQRGGMPPTGMGVGRTPGRATPPPQMGATIPDDGLSLSQRRATAPDMAAMMGMAQGMGGDMTDMQTAMGVPTEVDTGMRVVSQNIEIPDMTYAPGPDCRALAVSLRQSASGITPLLLHQIDALIAQQEVVVEEDDRRSSRRGSSRSRRSAQGRNGRPTAAEQYGGGMPRAGSPFGGGMARGGSSGRGATTGRPLEEQVEAPPLGQSKPLARASMAELIAALAVHGDSSALMMLSRLAQDMNNESPGYNELLIALARCGGGQALLQIRSAAENAPQEAAIALAMIDTPAARAALRDVVATWTVADARRAAKRCPDVVGVEARAALMDTLAEVHPEFFNETRVLNALLELDGYALERILVAQLFEPPKPVVQAPEEEAERGNGNSRGRGSNRAQRNQRQQAQQRTSANTGQMNVPPSWQILAQLKNTKAIAYLVDLLGGPNLQKKRRAMVALSHVDDESFIPTAAALLADRDRLTREYAVRQLVSIGSPKAIEVLHEAMKAELLFAAIPNAASELAVTGGRKATADLLAKMLDLAANGSGQSAQTGQNGNNRRPENMSAAGPDEATAESIVEALMALQVKTEATQAALEKARSSADSTTRTLAYQAMASASDSVTTQPAQGSIIRGLIKIASFGKIGSIAGTGGASGASISAAAMASGKDASPEVRAAGVAMLRGQSANEAAPVLQTLMSDPSAETRRVVMETVGTLTGDNLQITQILAVGLKDADPQVVIAAARAAGQRKQTGLGQDLMAALNKPAEAEVDQTATLVALINAAGKLGERSTVQSLSLHLGHEQPEIREAAAIALGEIGDENAVYSLRSMIEDPEERVRAASILALSKLHSQDAIRVSLEALSSSEIPQEVRAELLKRLVAECAEPGVYADWIDGSGELDEASLQTLVMIASQKLPELQAGFMHLSRRYLSNTASSARPYAAWMLACYAEDSQVRDTLADAFLQDPTGLSAAVAHMVKQMRDPEILPSLWKLYREIRTSEEISDGDGHVLTMAIVDAMANMKGDQAAQMLWRIGRSEQHMDIVTKVLEVLPNTESGYAVTCYAEAAGRAKLFGIETAMGLAKVAHFKPKEARVALMKIARSREPRAAAVAADVLEELEEANPLMKR